MSNKTDLSTHFHTRIDLPAETRAAMGMILNERLADYLDLERQAKQAHWNVRGARFQQLHELFDATAGLAVGWSDELAERAGQLGVPAEGTLPVIAERSRLSKAPLMVDHADEWVHVVAEALASCANAARANIEEASDADDAITADLLTRITSETDKQLWFVESHLEPEPK
ncbi:DNA starvation/stationary phase protection protein Dps [Gemmatimonas groenlandica]|uniref:DNA starvation/stationary phase protection protein Dps n=1 Tax=Gemmatimonas groenlandica TaxID=2732249 RepID=A0A6M4IRI4_9BACT|nr:DNA starvation/stationary phase protection protein Dps [Gemmatimonas groenlandica]QJR35462.1 DNA starvation/stationary phase protection protein Dps [Gemmatimonas groenlandica]